MTMEIAYPYRVTLSGDEARFESDSEILRLSPVNGKAVKYAVAHLDGSHTEDQLCDRYPKFEWDLREFFKAARHCGALVDRGEVTDRVSGRDLFQAVQKQIPHWNERLFSHPLWQGLYRGSVSHTVVRGWAIETYFFIRGASMRMPSVITACHNRAIKAIFLKHFTEEYDHYRFFATSLERLGLDVGIIEKRGALPTTDAVINLTKHAARLDPLCYAVCSGLLESTGTDADKGRDFYRAVARHYDGDGLNWVEPMLEHVNLDEDYGHGSVLQEIFEHVGTVDRATADEVFRTAELFVEALILWFDEILGFYDGRVSESCVLVYRV